jgi:hypothetical protein
MQNTVRVLLDAGEYLLPASSLGVFRVPAAQAVAGLERVLGQAPEKTMPLHRHPTAGQPHFDDFPAAELRVETAPAHDSQLVRRLELTLEFGLSLRQLRLLLRQLDERVLEAFRVPEGEADEKLLGCPVRVGVNETRNRGVGDDSPHRVVLRVPAETLPAWQERCWRNREEAERLLDYAAERSGQGFVATSPFFAQCLVLARLASERGLVNVTVQPPEVLGLRGSANEELLVSLVAGEAGPSYPFPLNEPQRLLGLFIGRYLSVHLFGSAELLDHHPLFRVWGGTAE